MGRTVPLDQAAQGWFMHSDLQPQLNGSVLSMPVVVNGSSSHKCRDYR